MLAFTIELSTSDFTMVYVMELHPLPYTYHISDTMLFTSNTSMPKVLLK